MRGRRVASGLLLATLALALSAGGALAHGGNGNGKVSCEERLAAIAKAKGVTVEQLKADRKAKAVAWVDKLLEKKLISAERAAALKAKIAASEGCAPLLGSRRVGHGGGKLRGGWFLGAGDAVLAYLGLTKDELRAELRKGQSLAEIAAAKEKTVDGLKAVITNELKTHLDKWLAGKRISQERYDKALAALPQVVDRIVTFKHGARGKGAKDKPKAATPSGGSSS
ncbi:MAG: hypothetical protein ACKVUT_15490 [Gaiella sp.]